MQSVFLIPPETVEFRPENYFVPLDLDVVFPGRSNAPLEVDLGSGDGGFLVEMANRYPNRNFLGVERLLGRVRKTCRRMARTEARNGRVIRVESHYLVRHLLPRGSVSVLHVMCPDPWPKRHHQFKRLIQTEFLDDAREALAPGGELRLTTDDLPYFKHMCAVFKAHCGFAEEPWTPEPDYPQTDFERLFRSQGLPIYRALLRRI
ncbi:MAG: tRNA (guanosine(46)-N7)-methyltransferase TrmB [Verrucomicrobia bacterium]|nr:tRNA (guanosine(46)-N7)-methyltransferase TrmB [Verrucomicrobiota bacterium]